MSAEIKHMKEPQTVSELIDGLVRWLGSEVWPGLAGYPDALPEPSIDRMVERSPFFCVVAGSGTAGVNQGTPATSVSLVTVEIFLQVRSSQSDGKNYYWAVRTLRNLIDGLRENLYNNPIGIVCGARPGSMSWEIPEVQPRPVWQARIRVEFELKSETRDNAGFLI